MRRLLLATALFAAATSQAAETISMDVHRDANCGCCKAWISHLEANGIQVNDHVESDMSAVKSRLGVPPRLASCHTGVIDGKFVEGHVPASDILKLRQRPDLLGAAVPGMPHGSPGMETGVVHAYQVIGLQKDGQEQVLTDYPAQ
ncbi:DUF411 domain-containing protein [Pseudomonas sp. J452]|uniref:DUF411 domain-containing protein n=1 Tax=Pseudomonas sp. J452 TaxID=2898441 RepID=UPI0021ADD5E0|nr:DUF411 domain-containing protein [Pseudomonas sp. J452]UUY10193.1 DUF411 domain-containing protein [Pseudomonas sp. J452]